MQECRNEALVMMARAVAIAVTGSGQHQARNRTAHVRSNHNHPPVIAAISLFCILGWSLELLPSQWR